MTKYILATLALFSQMTWATDFKVAVIDMQKAIFDTADGRKTKDTLEAEYNKAKADLGKLEESIHSAKAAYDKKYSVLSGEGKAKMEKDINAKVEKYQQAAAESQTQLQKHQSEMIQPIVAKINKLVTEIAHDRGYAMVIEKSPQVHYADDKLDLTSEVVRQYAKGS